MNDLNVQASWQGHLSPCGWPAWIWLLQLAGRGPRLPWAPLRVLGGSHGLKLEHSSYPSEETL